MTLWNFQKFKVTQHFRKKQKEYSKKNKKIKYLKEIPKAIIGNFVHNLVIWITKI